MKKLITYKRVYIFIILILLFTLISILVLNNNIKFIDDTIYNFINKFHSDGVTIFFKIITNMASPLVLILITILMLFFKNKSNAKVISINLLIILIINNILKIIFSRPRPIDMLIEENGYSFPSGHSMISMGFYGLLIYIIYINTNNKYIKWISIILCSILILLIGLSRIYLRVHYASDVLAGFLISLSYLILFISLYAKKELNVIEN